MTKSSVRNERLWLGFAHRFRPTYPGFPVGIGGVEQLHAAFFERKPHAWSRLVLRSRKSGQRWCEHGAPVWRCEVRSGLEGEACGIPPDVGSGDRVQKRVWMPLLGNVSLQRRREVGSETDWLFLHLMDRFPLMNLADKERPREGVAVLGAAQRSTLRSMIFYNSLKDVRLIAQTVHEPSGICP